LTFLGEDSLLKLDFESLYREANSTSFGLAKQKFYDNKINSVFCSQKDEKTVIYATVKGRSDHKCNIIFDENGELYDYSCDCSDFNMASGPCKHIVAAALAYEELNPSASAPQKTKLSDGVVTNLISCFGKNRRQVWAGREVSLIPTLILGQPLCLSFHIGAKKAYRLKDLNDFSQAVEGRAYRRYGVDLAFYHYPCNFDDRAKRVIKMLFSCPKSKFKNIMVLDNYMLDEFLDIYKDSPIKVEKDGLYLGVKRVFSCPPELNISVTKEDGGFNINCDQKGSLLRGGKFDYLVTDTAIYTLEQNGTELFTFLSATPFFVSNEDMPTFYNNVLAVVGSFASLKSDSDLTIFETPPLKAELYLDFDGIKVFGELKTFYADTEIDIFDQTVVDFRDKEAEDELAFVLKEYFKDFPSLEISNENDIYKLLRDGLSRLYGRTEIFLSENFKGLKITSSPRIKVGVKRSGNLLDLDFYADDLNSSKLDEILEGIRSGKNFIRIGSNFIDLNEAAKNLKGILRLPITDGKIAAYYSQYLKAELGTNIYDTNGALENRQIVDTEPVQQLACIMRPYQITGYKWLKTTTDFGYGGTLADDMGLGKSIQTIALIYDIINQNDNPCLIVCPTTLILNWIYEFQKFMPDISVKAISGTSDDRISIIRSLKKGDVGITSYELLRRDASLYENTFSIIVADEAQYIKNPLTKNASAIKSIKAERKLALTGTPIENSLSELWSIFDFLMPGYLFDYSTFRQNFETAISYGDKDAGERLEKMISPFILRRMKSDVLKELPPKIETTICSPLTLEQRDMYLAHVKMLKEGLAKKSKIAVLALLTKLRQICCDPSLISPDYLGNSEKLETLMQLVSNAVSSGHKVLVFSQFTSMLDIIAKKFDQNSYSYYVLKGETPKTERIKLINNFNNDNTGVFLISLKAGGTGINLTGADIVIHYDPWWNDSVMNQATDRSYRIGQQKNVQVYKLIINETVEEKIVELQKQKTKLGESFTGSADALGEIINYINDLNV